MNSNAPTGYVIHVGNYMAGGTRGITVGHWNIALHTTTEHVISAQIKQQ